MTSTQQHLTHLETVGLIKLAQTHPELEYLFRHALVQEVAYNSLLIADRKKLHLQAGEAMEQLYPNRLEELAPTLAYHFDIAGDAKRALKYFTLAGDVDFGVYANTEAVAHYTQALKIAARVEVKSEQLIHLYSNRGRALELNGAYDEALSNYRQMETVAHERNDQPLELASLIARATIRSIPGRMFEMTRGQVLTERALALARKLGNRPAEAKVLWNMMLLNMYSDHPHEAVAYGEQSLAIAREQDLREQLAFTLNDLHRSYQLIGQLGRGRAALEEARDLFREIGNLPMLADCLASSALTYYGVGEYEQALVFADEGYQSSQAIDSPWGQGFCRIVPGFVYMDRGEPDKAIEALEQAVHIGEQFGMTAMTSNIRAELAWVYGNLGAMEHGLELAHLARAALDTEPLPPVFQSWALAALARVEILSGNLARAAATIKEAYSGFDAEGFLTPRANFLPLTEGELALAKHDYEQVLSAINEYLTHLRSIGVPIFLPEALYLKGKALLAQGQTDEARQILGEARTEAESLGSQRMMWQILFTLSQLESDISEAKHLRQQAREIVEYIADHTPTAELRRSFLNLPNVRTLLDN